MIYFGNKVGRFGKKWGRFGEKWGVLVGGVLTCYQKHRSSLKGEPFKAGEDCVTKLLYSNLGVKLFSVQIIHSLLKNLIE
jgi:hypothetical protein